MILNGVLNVVRASSDSEQMIATSDHIKELVTRILTDDLLSQTAELIALLAYLDTLLALVLVVSIELGTY